MSKRARSAHATFEDSFLDDVRALGDGGRLTRSQRARVEQESAYPRFADHLNPDYRGDARAGAVFAASFDHTLAEEEVQRETIREFLAGPATATALREASICTGVRGVNIKQQMIVANMYYTRSARGSTRSVHSKFPFARGMSTGRVQWLRSLMAEALQFNILSNVLDGARRMSVVLNFPGTPTEFRSVFVNALGAACDPARRIYPNKKIPPTAWTVAIECQHILLTSLDLQPQDLELWSPMAFPVGTAAH